MSVVGLAAHAAVHHLAKSSWLRAPQMRTRRNLRAADRTTERSQRLSGHFVRRTQSQGSAIRSTTPEGEARHRPAAALKRVFDAALASAGLIASAPLWALFAAAITRSAYHRAMSARPLSARTVG